jgi:hypothetical protein
VKEFGMGNQKGCCRNVRTGNRRPPTRKASLHFSVAISAMTDQEARQFEAARNLLLSEMIRQRLDRGRKDREERIT